MDHTIIVFALSLISGFTALSLYKYFNLKKQWAIGIDINKPSQQKICESTGLTLLVPIWLSSAYLTILAGLGNYVIPWALLVSGFAIVGFIDDTRNKFLSKPLPWFVRAIPVFIFSLVFAYFFSFDSLPVIIVAFFIAIIASFQNTFAGLNGWEIGSGFIISIAVLFAIDSTPLFWIALMLIGAIVSLLLLNVYPATVFPGDSGTLLIGSGIAGILVMTKNPEIMFMGSLFFIPHIVDIALKAITNPKDMSQHKIKPYKVLSDGKIGIPDYPDGKIRYDFAKLLLKMLGPMKEWQIVVLIWCIVTLNCTIVLLLFGKI